MDQYITKSVSVALLFAVYGVSGVAQDRSSTEDAVKAEIVSVRTVGQRVEYQSDVDIVRYRDHFYMAFIKPVGGGENAIHILQSVDGRDWEAAATLRSEFEERSLEIRGSQYYGRPVWFSIMPSGRLCVAGRSNKAVLWSTDDGSSWSEEVDIDLNSSYSRIAWQKDRAYSASDESSSCGEQFEYFGIESADNASSPEMTYRRSHDTHKTRTGPRESQLAFGDDRAYCLLSFETYDFDPQRRWLVPSNSYGTGQLGVAEAPYEEWTWVPTNLKFGRPNLMVLSDKRIIANVFIEGDEPCNVLCQVDATNGELIELLRLPTGATRQHVGMTEHDGHVWVSFYRESKNEKAPAIMKVAKIKLGT